MTSSEPYPTSWLALDVGGANLKAAHSQGNALSLPFQLWKHPDQLSDALKGLITRLPPFDRLALTMTGELCDCYSTKAEGVRAIVASTLPLAASERIQVWGVDGQFHTVEAIQAKPALAAAMVDF